MQGNTPIVSIGLPVHNGEQYLSQAVDSLLAQDFPFFELILSDNASSDGTGALCAAYSGRDSRIRYYRQSTNIGAVDNFNSVLRLASGRYFMWASHDDMWEPTFVSSLVKQLDDHPRAVLAFSAFDNLDQAGRRLPPTTIHWQQLFSRSKFRQFAAMVLMDESASQKSQHIFGLMRRDALLACDGLACVPDPLKTGHDFITLLRLLARGEFVTSDQVLFHYRLRAMRTRGNKPILAYLWARMFGRVEGHRGNLLGGLRDNHIYHSEVRKVILKETPLSWTERMTLWIATCAKELWTLVRAFLPAALRQLRR